METLGTAEARRLALARAGLLKPELTEFPRRATGTSLCTRKVAHRVIQRFGYLQLDTVSVAGARSHAIVLLSRLDGFGRELAEELLQPHEPLFEYWGHEASWIPMELYPVFEFRRRGFRHHPWAELIRQYPQVARDLRSRIRDDGPLRSADMDGPGSRGWWDLKIAKRIAIALWSSGELAVRERRKFQRTYDLAERVIPDRWRDDTVSKEDALEELLLRALQGHGWGTTGTLAQTWRLRNQRREINAALDRLVEKDRIRPCALVGEDGTNSPGWIRPDDLELVGALSRVRPRPDRGVLLSPFDPILWDRNRVRQLFGFDQILEIYKPAQERVYGYYCLPVLAGERLVARLDLKAERKTGKLHVLSCRFGGMDWAHPATAADQEAARQALCRYAAALDLTPAS